jgi:hypothetical protein
MNVVEPGLSAFANDNGCEQVRLARLWSICASVTLPANRSEAQESGFEGWYHIRFANPDRLRRKVMMRSVCSVAAFAF